MNWKAAGLHSPSYFRLFLVTLPQASVRLIGRLSSADWQTVQGCVKNGLAPY